MDWMDRDIKPGQSASQDASLSSDPAVRKGSKHKRDSSLGAVARLVATIFLFSAVILTAASLVYLAIGGRNNDERRLVDTKKLQAVFLNGGQVYFGDITELNSKYLVINGVYYLRVNEQGQATTQQQTSNNVSLIKLGCELHGPTDQMVINRDQVIFWENMKGDGKVTKAVEQYVKDNPKGQDCNQTGASSSTTQAQGAQTTTGSSPATTNPTTKP